MITFHVIANRDGKFWLVHIPELCQYTQARNIPEVEVMARDLIALILEAPAESIHIKSEIQLPEDAQLHLKLANRFDDDANWAQHEAAKERRIAARALRDEGFTVRDIGHALGVSRQRARKILDA